MAWECAECIREEMTAVCHHCGKPLCEEHAVVVPDDALAEYDRTVFGRDRAVSDHAVHCEDCQRQHHPKAQVVTRPVEQVGT
jgi:hypothetical protein